MKKKLAAFVLSSSMVLSLAVPAFAAATNSDPTKAPGEYLKEIGVIKGDQNGDLLEDSNWKRQDVTVLLSTLLGKKDEAKATADTHGFTDVRGDAYDGFISWAKENKFMVGATATTFGFDAEITNKDFAAVLLRAFGFEVAYADVEAAALEQKILPEGTDFSAKITRGDSYSLVVAALNMTVPGTGQTLGNKLGLPGFEVKELDAVTATVTAANKIEVKFNRPVAQEAVKLEVKRGTSVVEFETKWSEDKTTAELTRNANIVAGDYVVNVTGLKADKTFNVKVEAQKVTSIDFVGGDLIKNAAGTEATFRYIVKDQYGTDITKTTSASGISVSGVVGNSTYTPVLTPSTSTGKISRTFVTTDTTAVVTLVHNATGISKSATLNVAAAAKVNSFEFGTNILPSGKTRIEQGLNPAVTIPVTAKDQYDNVIDSDTNLAASMILASSDPNVTVAFAKNDNKTVIQVNTSALNLVGVNSKTIVISAVTIATGTPYTYTIEVVKAAAPHAVEIGDFNVETIAVGDTVYAPLNVTTQFGDTLTAAQVVSNAATINGMISGWNSQFSSVGVETNRDSANYGKLKLVASNTGTFVLVVNTPAGVTTKTLEVKAARKVSEVKTLANVTLLQGANTDLKFPFYDQYQALIGSQSAANDNGDLTFEVTVTKVSGDDAGITVNKTTGTSENDVKAINVVADANKTGTYKVTLDLLNSSNVVVSSASTNVTVAKNNVAGLTYTVKDVAVLAGDDSYSATDAHARKIEVEAKDANGTTYILNKNDIVGASSSDPAVANVGANSGDWYVFGNDITANNTANKTAVVTVSINTLDGLKTVTKEVTVAPQVKKVQEVRVVDAASVSGDANTALTGAGTTGVSGINNKTSYTVSRADAEAGIELYVIGKDQYGVWTKVAAPSAIVNSTNNAPYNAFSYSNGELVLAGGLTNVTVGQDILVTVAKDTGAAQITIRITA